MEGVVAYHIQVLFILVCVVFVWERLYTITGYLQGGQVGIILTESGEKAVFLFAQGGFGSKEYSPPYVQLHPLSSGGRS